MPCILAAPRHRVPNPVPIVLAEHFEPGAQVSSKVAAALTPGERVVVATSEQATRAGRGVGAVPLPRLAGRRARLAALRRRRDLQAAGRGPGGSGRRDLPGRARRGVRVRPRRARRAHCGRVGDRGVVLVVALGRCRRPLPPRGDRGDDQRAKRRARRCRRRPRPDGARACLIQHGLLTLHNEAYLDHDRYLVWGDRDRRALVDLGAAPATVAVTGSPAMDHVADRRAAQAGGTEPRSRHVLYLPSRSDGRFITTRQAEAMLEAVKTAVEAVPGATLTVKVHPSDRSTVFDDVPGAVVVRSGDVLELIATADVVVASTSTAGLEACALNRPVLLLAPPGIEVPDDYQRYDAAVVVGELDPAVIGAALAELVDDGPVALRLAEGRRALVDDVFDGLVPGAAGRIAEELRAMAADHEPAASAVGSPR